MARSQDTSVASSQDIDWTGAETELNTSGDFDYSESEEEDEEVDYDFVCHHGLGHSDSSDFWWKWRMCSDNFSILYCATK